VEREIFITWLPGANVIKHFCLQCLKLANSKCIWPRKAFSA